MNTGHSILLIAIASGITFLIRAFPFLVFKKRQMPGFPLKKSPIKRRLLLLLFWLSTA